MVALVHPVLTRLYRFVELYYRSAPYSGPKAKIGELAIAPRERRALMNTVDLDQRLPREPEQSDDLRDSAALFCALDRDPCGVGQPRNEVSISRGSGGGVVFAKRAVAMIHEEGVALHREEGGDF